MQCHLRTGEGAGVGGAGGARAKGVFLFTSSVTDYCIIITEHYPSFAEALHFFKTISRDIFSGAENFYSLKGTKLCFPCGKQIVYHAKLGKKLG